MKELEAKYGPQILAALGVTGIAAAIAQAKRHGTIDSTAISGAVKGNVRYDTTAAAKQLQSMYQEAGQIGAETAAGQIGADTVLDNLPSVQDLLDRASITVKNITDTQMSQISTTIENGIRSGLGSGDITEQITGIIGDPARAQLIAVTETNRAYNAATTDTFIANGITRFNWVAYDGACPECEELQAGSPYDVGDEVPPDHPNCRCWQSPTSGE